MDAASRYHEVYARWQPIPKASGARRRTPSTGSKAQNRARSERRHLRPLVRRRRLNTCFNALDRHVDAGRGDQTALIYDGRSPGKSAPSPIIGC